MTHDRKARVVAGLPSLTQVVSLNLNVKAEGRRNRSNDLNLATCAALAADHLPALLGSHAGAEPKFAGSLDMALLMGVMHR
jgi:hypothetical protein